jgi:hypothetical protein
LEIEGLQRMPKNENKLRQLLKTRARERQHAITRMMTAMNLLDSVPTAARHMM